MKPKKYSNWRRKKPDNNAQKITNFKEPQPSEYIDRPTVSYSDAKKKENEPKNKNETAQKIKKNNDTTQKTNENAVGADTPTAHNNTPILANSRHTTENLDHLKSL